MLGEFRDFIVRGNVIDLAVGLVAGAAFGALVASLVQDVVTPMIGLVFAIFGGQPDFSAYTLLGQVEGEWKIFSSSTESVGGILVGSFANAVIVFLSTMAGLYFFVVKPANALTARLITTSGDDAPELRECPECLDKVPASAKRCRSCTSELTPTA